MVSGIGGSSLGQMYLERTFPQKDEDLDLLKSESSKQSSEESADNNGLERTVDTRDFAGALRDLAELERAAVKDDQQPLIAVGGRAESLQPAHLRLPQGPAGANFWQLQVSGASLEEF